MKIKEKRIVEEICTAMKNRRIALKLSQAAASEKSDVKISTLRKYENTGSISLQSLIKLLIAYKMDVKLLSSFKDRSDWTLKQIERAETKKKIRPKMKPDTGIWVIPIENADFGAFTPGKKYKTLYREGTFTSNVGNMTTGRSFIIKDDNGKELLITDDYCEKIIENE